MKFVKAAAYAVVVLVVGATVYSHLILSPGIHHESAAGDRSHPMFHSAGDNIMPVAASFHRPPARPLGTDWAGSASEINCLNQSSCIQSELQVKRQFSIYMCKKVGRHGSRFYYLLSDGLERHPAVTVTEDIDAADLVLFLPSSSPWHKSECTNSSLADRLVIMDEFDGSSAFSPRKSFEELKRDYAHKIVDSKNVMWYFLYFKRSYVHRKDGKFLRYPFLLKKDFFPMVYSIADSYVRPQFNKERSLLLTCTLRGDMKYQPSRLRVLEWVHEYANKHELPLDRVVIGQVRSYPILQTKYWDMLVVNLCHLLL